jgi:metal-responsive CopG/Arc/MetJ family transcriptional regulator
MKTAISLPDHLYEDAERTAKAMGIPRSQLFARAVEEFIEQHRNEKITEQLNKVYAAICNQKMDNTISLNTIRELTKNDSW